ncbi:tumor necrosis factor receptor superfamily member 10B isoform X3 [Myotis daubentonii]|uniref:tumor necrosis factor receptor superfamily member 10B isoform X3 n=1 Tax=Myotis daubentonii TaxID=98922 RepID=UPI002873E507|nr:tumor necrosis factor receptor superfamily member 10B isoform X3 [Myotis daubentonii]
MASRRAVGRAAALKAQGGAGPRPWAPGTLILVLLLFLVLIQVASCPITEPDRIHQQPAAPQGLHASLPEECPPGFYLSEQSREYTPCTEKEDSTRCPNRHSSCHPCSNCPADKVQIAACTRTNDTQCQCKKGFYQDKDSPEYCQPCSPRCPDGKVKVRDCGPTNDLECVDQKSGIQDHREAPVPGEPVTTSLEAPTAPSLSSGTPWWVIMLACIFGIGGPPLLGTFLYWYYRSRNLPCSGVATKSRSRVSGFLQDLCRQVGRFGGLRTPGEAEALDNARNLARSDRDSLSSEQEQEELAGVLVQPAGKAQLLLGPTGTDGSQMRRKLLVPANNENAIETLRECFYEFSRIVPFTRWEPFMRLAGLPENDISIAKAQVSNHRDALYLMLTTWINIKGKAASVNTLLDSLDTLGETKAKEEMQDFLLESGKYVYEVGEAGSAVSQ